jgi:hypothetical protein
MDDAVVYIGRWRPSSVSQAAAFARDVITRAAPEGRERAKNLLWAARWTSFAVSIAEVGASLTVGTVYSWGLGCGGLVREDTLSMSELGRPSP